MRHDHTDWLTHFVRDRDAAQDFPGETEDEYNYYVGGELSPDASAFEVLKSIIRLGGITPGFSFRKGKTTIYGGKPALCATEMPLYSFASYVRSRGNTSKVSAYGISFLKSEFFKAGGRPAIYGISAQNISYQTNTNYSRILAESVLPTSEQYRYVTYNPVPERWIDWSHEREWRWVVQDDDLDEIFCERDDGTYDQIGALPLFKGSLEGRSFSRCCIIVQTHEEAKEVQEILTGLYIAECNNYDTPFDKKFIKNSSIITLNEVISAVEKDKKINAQTIEGLDYSNLLTPIIIHNDTTEYDDIISNAVMMMNKAVTVAEQDYSKKMNIDDGYCGYANVISYDVTNPIIQKMLKMKIASGPYDGKVIINFKKNAPLQSMDFNEKICKVAVTALKEALALEFYMESRPD